MEFQTGYLELLDSSEPDPAVRPSPKRRRRGRPVRGAGASPARTALLILSMVVAGTLSFLDRVGEEQRVATAAPLIERTVLYTPLMKVDGEPLAQVLRRELGREERQRAVSEKVARYRAYRLSPDLADLIFDRAAEHGIDPDIAFGLVRAESSFRNSATSRVGAVGLAQLMPRTARWMVPGTTVRDLRNPETNLDIGFQYLSYLLQKYDGDMELALLAYNRGPGTVDRILRRGGNPHNGYVQMVTTAR